MRHAVSKALCAVLAALLLTSLVACFGPADANGGTTVSALDGAVSLTLPDGWEEMLLDEDADDPSPVLRTVFSYKDAGDASISDGSRVPAVSVEISCIRLVGDGAQYLTDAGANYETVHASFPESGQFTQRKFGSAKGYFGLFYDAGDDGFLGPWATTCLKTSSGEDMIVHAQFQIQESWYEENEAMITQIIDSLRVHPPYSGDVTSFMSP